MSPATSKAQFRKMFQLYKEHRISKQTLDEFTRGVNFKSLPTKKKGKKNAGRSKKSNQSPKKRTR